MADDWSQIEVEAIVADYFAMWEQDLLGMDYNKAEHNRRLLDRIPGRNRSSVEQKHRNISAVLWHLGYPYLRGYKPLPKYQRLLRSVVEDRLANQGEVNRLVARAVAEPVEVVPVISKSGSIQVAPPKTTETKKLVEDEVRRKTTFVRRNYLEDEANNRSLGLAGEEFVINFERDRLERSGKRKLADRVEHVSITKGDFLGYDILSFETTGRERLIEVKTTRYGLMTRFFASINEVEVSESRGQEYHLLRLFNFERDPQFFVLSGPLRETCQLKPVSFSATPV